MVNDSSTDFKFLWCLVFGVWVRTKDCYCALTQDTHMRSRSSNIVPNPKAMEFRLHEMQLSKLITIVPNIFNPWQKADNHIDYVGWHISNGKSSFQVGTSHELRDSKSSFAFQKVQAIALINNNVSFRIFYLILALCHHILYLFLTYRDYACILVGPFVRSVWLSNSIEIYCSIIECFVGNIFHVNILWVLCAL